jgi:hypothetical protein
MRRESLWKLNWWTKCVQTASQPAATRTRRCDMSWKELVNLGAGGVGGRRGGRRREAQGIDFRECTKILIQPESGPSQSLCVCV